MASFSYSPQGYLDQNMGALGGMGQKAQIAPWKPPRGVPGTPGVSIIDTSALANMGMDMGVYNQIMTDDPVSEGFQVGNNKMTDKDKGYALMMAGLGTLAAKPGTSALGSIAQGAGIGLKAGMGQAKERETTRIAKEDRDIKSILAQAALAKAKPQPDMKQMVGADGKVYNYNANSLKPVYEQVFDEAGDALIGKPPGGGIKLTVGGPGGGGDWAKNDANEYNNSRTAARGAEEMLGAVTNLRRALKGAPTGALQPSFTNLQKFGNALGVPMDEIFAKLNLNVTGTAATEDINRLTSEIALGLAKQLLKGQGSVTNAERAEVEKLVGGLGTSAPGNEAALKRLDEIAQAKIDRFDFMENYLMVTEENPKPSLRNFTKAWREERKTRTPDIKLTDDQLVNFSTTIFPGRPDLAAQFLRQKGQK
mgnify:CR=1 FL=1